MPASMCLQALIIWIAVYLKEKAETAKQPNLFHLLYYI